MLYEVITLENTQDEANKVAEIRLEIPGNELFAKKQSKSFEESTDTAIDALIKQIAKVKKKNKRAWVPATKKSKILFVELIK